ncbi:MAG: ferredoxin [Clostridia bacterium]
MKLKHYTISDECIGCRACAQVAEGNFEMNDSNKAYVAHQPSTEAEEQACREALEVCPVDAISVSDEVDAVQDGLTSPELAGVGDGVSTRGDGQPAGADAAIPILARNNVRETLERHPELKPILLALSPKFKRLENPFMYNALTRFASFADAARVSGVSICEILHTLNAALGLEKQLIALMPECIACADQEELETGVAITWQESPERYVYNYDSMPELLGKLTALGPGQSIVMLAMERPDELVNAARELGLLFNLEKGREYRVSIFNPAAPEPDGSWRDKVAEFDKLDVRTMMTDPFDVIMKKAYATPAGSGFTLVQGFEPQPLINMLSETGFDHHTEKKSDKEYHIHFSRRVPESGTVATDGPRVPVVIQSATPVAWPVIMRLLQSEKLQNAIEIRELKVWEETEKHLAWIQNGKADISFSALITAAKLSSADLKIPALIVWDNFSILTRHKAATLADLRGQTIAVPLFEEAPPAKITRYLISASGLDPDEFRFSYGTPFGRPERIYADFVAGTVDTVVLREPEVSYALKKLQDRGEQISVISYNDLWNSLHPGFGSYPNAGVVFKGEFARQHPELVRVFLEELRLAVDWVNAHRAEAAALCWDIMGQDVQSVDLFLQRVHFEYADGKRLTDVVRSYFDVLNANGITNLPVTDSMLDTFRLD